MLYEDKYRNMKVPNTLTKDILMRYISLDLVRCFAVALLLIAHIGQTIHSPIGDFFGVPHFYFVSLGGLAVTIFLILSGTVIELQYSKKNVDYLLFILKRILRIYPVYYLCLLFGIVIYFFQSYHDTGHIFASFSKIGIVDILCSITGSYAFIGRWSGPFVGTSWFISLIITMYVFYPFLSQIIRKQPLISICILLFISTLSRLILGTYEVLPKRPLDWFPLCRVFEFSFGIYLATSLPKKTFDFLKASRRFRSVATFISALSFPLFLIHYPILFIINYLTSHGVNMILSICCYISISLILSWIILAIDNRLPRSRILKIIGYTSKKKIYELACG